MGKRRIIYILSGVVIAVFLLYNSVYFASLAERREALQAQVFNSEEVVGLFWKEGPEKLREDAVEMEDFNRMAEENPQELAEKYGKTLGIGAPYSILIKGKAKVESLQNDVAGLQSSGRIKYGIRTGSVFSNTMREASGYFDLDKFETTMDFNLIAIEINARIVKEIISPVASRLVPGTTVEFLGAADINLRRLPVASVEIVPLQLRIEAP